MSEMNNLEQGEKEGTEKGVEAEHSTMAASALDGVAATALRSVLSRVQRAAESSGRCSDQIRVVAVSKTKPVSVLREVYDAGHRCFGENYVQEILEKAPQLPEDIHWHFIGNLQSNKVKPLLAGVPNLAMVETVDDEKGIEAPFPLDSYIIGDGVVDHYGVFQHLIDNPNLTVTPPMLHGLGYASLVQIANHLDRAVASIGRKPLKVLVQVNTSGEASKFGVDPSGCVELAKHVSLGCPNLEFSGLMTIGMLDYTSTPENFKTLANCRNEVCKALGITDEQCELSMGMSGDFELAIEMGSTNVRIGSTIFGAREYPKKKTDQ